MKAHAPGHTARKSGVGFCSQTSFLLRPSISWFTLLLSFPISILPVTGARPPSGRQVIDFSREGGMGEALG